jgi:hypothetical protein
VADLELTRDETLFLVYEKLGAIRAEVEDCDELASTAREISRRQVEVGVEVGKESALVRVKDFPEELRSRIKRIGANADRAMKIIDAHESARLKAQRLASELEAKEKL